MRSQFSFKSALVGGLFVALLLSAVPVGAAVGDVIRAGQSTSANNTTNLKGSAEFQNLKVTNTRAVGVAARFVVEPGNPPFHVSSGVTVPKLNADRVDGVHAAGLLKKKDYDPDKDGSVVSADTVEGVGLDGLLPGALAPGQTVTGAFYLVDTASGANEYQSSAISYIYSLPAIPLYDYLRTGDAFTAECPGNSPLPQAAPGYLCVYEEGADNVRFSRGTDQRRATGFGVWNRSDGSGTFYTHGTWAATAPLTGAAGTDGADKGGSGPTK